MMTFSDDPRVAEQEMHAILFALTSFGYIDGHFDASERTYIRDYIRKLVDHRARQAKGKSLTDEAALKDVVDRWTRHFHEVLDEIDHQISDHFTESVGEGESSEKFVLAKLKLRCFELFTGFDEENRAQLLATVDELIRADGVIDAKEEAFRAEIHALLHAPMSIDEADLEVVEDGASAKGQVVILAATHRPPPPREQDHPFFKGAEWDYAGDDATFTRQAEADMKLIERAMATLEEQRRRGAGRLASAQTFPELAATPAGQDGFLDGHVYFLPAKPGKDYELLVIGDLHGCYSCLKAALLQADFFGKVEAHHKDPEHHPATKLVLLGDYIDRGRYSYNGILRTAMQLFVAVPEHVYLLRGNHEYYVELNGKVLAPVRPAEAMQSLAGRAPNDLFASYMRLFESLANTLVFDRTLFVHAGIPRDATQAARWTGLSSLNDPEIRFEMLWSDPSEADAIPDSLQQENARFPFGKRQFKAFMARLGCNTMVRGHERFVEGFRTIYDLPEARLLSLFSAGGAENNDLPAGSNYREVSPMALTIRHRDGKTEISPFLIDYLRYNDPKYNSFLRAVGT